MRWNNAIPNMSLCCSKDSYQLLYDEIYHETLGYQHYKPQILHLMDLRNGILVAGFDGLGPIYTGCKK